MRIQCRHRVLAVVGVLALGACSLGAMNGPEPTTRPAATIDGTAWVLQSLPGRTLVPQTQPTLQFAHGRVTGTDGCNRFAGGYESNGADFRLMPGVVATQMACGAAVAEQASVFMRALTDATGLRLGEGTLALLGSAGTELAAFVAQSTRLAGSSWRVSGINNGKGAVASLLAETNVTLEFGAEGQVAGWAGCNRYTTRYTEGKGGAIQFEPPASTRKLCPQPGVMEQEQQFLRALESAAAVRVEGDRLELRRADEALALTAYRAGSD